MENNAYIIGWGHSKFGNSDCADLEALIKEVVPSAIEHAGIEPTDIDGAFLGTFNNGFLKQTFEAGLIGMAVPELRHVPAVHLENACATGSAAMFAGLDFIRSGSGRIALVIGAEKMTTLPPATAADLMICGSYVPEEAHYSPGFAGIFSEIAQKYFSSYGDRSEELAKIAAKNHHNGTLNPFAHMRKDLGFDFCNTATDKNPFVAGPLRRTDCSPISDGAAVIVLASADVARSAKRSVRVKGYSQANDFMAISRRDPCEFLGATIAWNKALQKANVPLEQLDFIETHDCFTIAELIEYEALGLAPRGQAYRLINEGATTRDGRIPVNPSGGLKSRGHPLGATGVSMQVMAAMQLSDEAGTMQLSKANMAGVFNMGGAAVSNYATILERVK